MRTPQSEARELVLLTIKWVHTGFHFSWGNHQYSAKLTVGQLATVLQRISAKDVASVPKSVRKKTYIAMAQEAKAGTDEQVWVWTSELNNLIAYIQVCAKIEDVLKETEITVSPFEMGNLVKLTKRKPDQIREHLAQAVELTKDSFGVRLQDFSEKEFSHCLSVLDSLIEAEEETRRDEARKPSLEAFLASGKSARDYIEDLTTTNMAGSETIPFQPTAMDKKADDPGQLAKELTPDPEKLDKEARV